MIALNSKKRINVNGVEVIPDHADPNLLHCLLSEVSLAVDNDTNIPKFTFIKFREEASDAGIEGGGYLMFEVELKLDEETRQQILTEGRQLTSGTPVLSIVPFDEGTVECVALDLQGGGGTSAEVSDNGGFVAVEHILGTSQPLYTGPYSAIFSLALSKEGAIILEQAFEQGAAPIGVIYKFKYTGLRPALNVEITADFKRIYTHFSAGLEGQYYFLKGSIEAGFEKLRQDGAIDIKVSNFVPESEQDDVEEQAMKFFTEKLMPQFFTPSLDLGKLQGAGGDGASTVDKVIAKAGDLVKGAKDKTEDKKEEEKKDEDKKTSGDKDNGKKGEAEGKRQSATLELDPKNEPGGIKVKLEKSTEGEEETLTITGGKNLSIKAGTQTLTRDDKNQVKVKVPHGSTVDVVIEEKGKKEKTQTFELFFCEDRPRAREMPRIRDQYLRNAPVPADTCFTQNTVAPDQACSQRKGADALRDWINNCLVEPKTINQITAHASWDSDDNHEFPKESEPKHADTDSELAKRNKKLSQDRLDIARAIIGNLATIKSAEAMGDLDARKANPSRNDDPKDRVVKIVGVTEKEGDSIRIKATLKRPKKKTGTPTNGGNPPKETNGKNEKEIAGNPALAFKLKFLRQDEQKKLTYRYNRADAVQRDHIPQGFFRFLLEGLDKDNHFVVVDLNDPFYRLLNIRAEAPINYETIGLNSVHLDFEYDDESKFLTFDKDSASVQRLEYGISAEDPSRNSYTLTKQYHFSDELSSGWDGEKQTYAFPEEVTEDRTLHVNPFEELGFLNISVEPTEIDWKAVARVDLFLTYDEDPNYTLEKQMVFTQSKDAPQTWKLRTTNPELREYSHRAEFLLTDGSVRVVEGDPRRATSLALNDPFDDALKITFVPVFPSNALRLVIVEVEYFDQENNYRRNERVEFEGDQLDPEELRIAIFNSEFRTFSLRTLFVGTDNSIRQVVTPETTDTLIVVAPPEVEE